MSGVDHPLKRAIDGRAADARLHAAHEVEEVVRAEVPFLTQKDIEDAVALARTLAAFGPEIGEIGKRTIHRVNG